MTHVNTPSSYNGQIYTDRKDDPHAPRVSSHRHPELCARQVRELAYPSLSHRHTYSRHCLSLDQYPGTWGAVLITWSRPLQFFSESDTHGHWPSTLPWDVKGRFIGMAMRLRVKSWRFINVASAVPRSWSLCTGVSFLWILSFDVVLCDEKTYIHNAWCY